MGIDDKNVEQLDASEFPDRCLSLLDHLGPDGIFITKHGRPVARPIPIDCEALIGSMTGKGQVKGDVFSTGIAWDAES